MEILNFGPEMEQGVELGQQLCSMEVPEQYCRKIELLEGPDIHFFG